MKQRTLLLIVILFVGILAKAQTIQPGVVKEYNEKLSKTDLGDVEIVISNASSTTSDAHGAFMLQFRTLKPGDKVNVRRIEKLGYEIFNKEALGQWFISRDGRPFTIIMCKSDRFKRIRDNYSRVSSESYNRQLKKEEAGLAEERKLGKLREAEYEAALKKLNDEYDQQLDNLDNYVDRFARIDLSELSETEANIIELVQKGEIERAVQLYEEQNLEDKFKQQVALGRKAEVAIDTLTAIRIESFVSRDSLFASILRKNEMLKLAGGHMNFEKVTKSLKEVVMTDSTYMDAVWEYAQHCQLQADYKEAVTYYLVYIRGHEDKKQKALAMVKLADTYMRLKQYEECRVWEDQALTLIRELCSYDGEAFQELLATALVSKGTMHYELNQLNEATRLFDEASTIYRTLSLDGTETHLYTLSKMLSNQGNLYRRLRKFDRAEEMMTQSLALTDSLFAVNPTKYRYDLATTNMNIGLIKKELSKTDESERFYKEALKHMEVLFLFNPKAYREELFKEISNLGVLYKSMKRFEDAEPYYLKALAHADTLYSINQEAYAVYLGNCLLNTGNLYTNMKRYEDALRYLKKSKPILQGLYERTPKAFIANYFGVNLSLGNVSMHLNKQQDSEKYFLIAEELGEKLYALSPKAYGMEYYMILKNLGITYMYIDDTDKAEKYNLKTYDFIFRLYQEKPEAYEKEFVSTCYVLGDFYKGNKKKDDAFEYFKKVMEIGQGNSKYSNYVEKAKNAFEEMGGYHSERR